MHETPIQKIQGQAPAIYHFLIIANLRKKKPTNQFGANKRLGSQAFLKEKSHFLVR